MVVKFLWGCQLWRDLGIADDYDSRLHTQLWIDPAEEFLEYEHAGDPVDVTFGVKELKVIL